MKQLLKNVPYARAAAWRLRALGRLLSADSAAAIAAARGLGSGRDARADDLALIRAEWRDQGATPALVARARSMSRNSVAWAVLPPRTWLVFCAVLLEAGDREGAERILRTWVTRCPEDFAALSTCLPVAQFARELGVRARSVERAAEAADVLARNRDADVFGTLVAGRTVAVVGNGPGPLGAGRGSEIDAHDLVVRFNNFPPGYEADYGARTDIWVRGAHREVRDRAEIEDFSLVLWEMDLFRNLLELPSHRDVLYRDTQFSPGRVAHVDTATKLSLRERSGLLLPTSGAQLLWMLHEARGSLDGVEVYGFSTIDGTGDLGHYFDSLGDLGRRHDAEGEGAFLRSLLGREALPGERGWVAAAAAAEELTRPGPSVVPPHPDAPPPVGEVTVVSCAYRRYDPARGKTGGPGGVLATQRLALGDEYRGQQLDYRFEDDGRAELRRRLGVQVAGLSGKVADIVLGGEFVRTDPEIVRELAAGRTMLFVCHELGTAYGAYLLGVPYVLVYHQQGSTCQEMRSNGRLPTPHEANVADRLERVVLENAQRVYFPSLGARETYRSTARLDEAHRIPFADRALYNTVSAVDHGEDEQDRGSLRDALRRELGLPPADEQTDVFVSVGDFNRDKGLDRVPELLDRYAVTSGRRVVWVAVGAPSDVALLDALRAQAKGWRFSARLVGERMTHDRLLALLDLADYYVMLHRNSIFDLATLEAMRAGKALVLSPVGGNVEVDLDDNVLFVTEDTVDDACRTLAGRDRVAWGEANRRVFEEHFSLERFAERYRAMLDEQLEPLLDGAADPAVEPAPAVAGWAL